MISDIPGSGMGWMARYAGNGLLIEPGDAGALAAAVSRLRGYQPWRGELGSTGRAALMDRLGIARVAQEIFGPLSRDAWPKRKA